MSHPFRSGQTVDAYLAEHTSSDSGGDGTVVGERRLVPSDSPGFLAEQVWTGSAWRTIDFVRDSGTGTGTTGRTQFESERQLDVAQATRLSAQTDIDREALAVQKQQLRADIAATKQRLEEIRLEADLAFKNEDRLLTKRLEAEREMLTLRLDNDFRQLLVGEIGAERRALIAEQGETRRLEASLQGVDPFRQANLLSGQAQRGRTPAQLFSQQNQAFLNQPLPQVNANAPFGTPQQRSQTLAALQAQLTGAQQRPQQPLAPPVGLAQGGIIEMGRGSNGAFSMKPMSFLVGEGAGIIPGITEVLTIGGGKVTVSPLAGGFQEGGTVFTPLPEGYRLIRQIETGGIFLITPDGQVRHFAPPSASGEPQPFIEFGFNLDDIEEMSFDGPLHEVLGLREGPQITLDSEFPAPPVGPTQQDITAGLQALSPGFAGLTEFVPRTQTGPFGGTTAARDFFSFEGQNLVQDPFTGQFRPFLPGLPEGVTPQALQNAPTSFGAPVVNQGAFNPQNLAALGFNPQLQRLGGQEDIFYRDPTTGELRQFGTPDIFEQSGFNLADVFNISPAGQQFNFGQPITSPLPLPVESGNIAPFGAPLIDPFTGALLADPRKIAGTLQQLQLEQPSIFNNLLSVYGLAGLQPEAFINRFQGATPTGAFTNPPRLGFTGRIL